MPCCLTFKRAQVKTNSFPFINIVGHCTSCNSNFRGFIELEPRENARAVFKCFYSGDFKNCNTKDKRRMIGKTKLSAYDEVCKRNASATLYRNVAAAKIMKFGDPEPSHLPTLNALRIMKCKDRKKDYIHDNPIIAINVMMHSPQFKETIRALGYEPFYVYYWMLSQIQVYNTYCKEQNYTKICIDATGSVVKKLARPFNATSGHIFLYEIAILDEISNMQYSVCNMLSETHDNNSIHNWLTSWIRSGALSPKEVICDHSIALLSACVRAFTQYSSLIDYLNTCGILVLNKKRPRI